MQAVALGIDIGTSGVRAVALDQSGEQVAASSSPFTSADETRRPSAWWSGVEFCLNELARTTSLNSICGLAVDGTSGTVLALDTGNAPIGDSLLYNDICPDADVVAAIANVAPSSSPARGASSALGKAIVLSRRPGVTRVVHQADWIAMQLGEGIAASDENNALKTGYELASESWPDWLEKAGMDRDLLPKIQRAGSVVSSIGAFGRKLGLPATCQIFAGTTDGCASFLATGASEIGDAVTALGSTLVLKLASDRQIDAPEFGIYSHRVGTMWLVGGASNTGGNVIRALIGDDRLDALTAELDPATSTGLDYYPLVKPGERFPINDANHQPRLTPRPESNAVFFQGILEGIAEVEKLGFDRLKSLGAPVLRSVRTVGGGARNTAWQQIRQQKLGVPFLAARSVDAAAGAAMLVLRNGAAS